MSAANLPWRRRLAELGRGAGKPHAPLFAPLLYGVASQIEALPATEVTVDPTRLGKCLVELGRVLGTTAIVTAAPSAMEAEALGASVDRGTWPPRVVGAAPADVLALGDFDERWSRSEALVAALETTRRLAVTQAGEPVLLVALTGPGRLLEELLERGREPDADAYETAGRALAALTRQFAEAGAAGFVLCEREPPRYAESWSAALSTIANVARFHRLPAFLAFARSHPSSWPNTVVACPAPAGEAAVTRPHGMNAGVEIDLWPDLVGRTGSARIVVTAAEVAAETPIETLQGACEATLAIERELD